MKPLENDHIDAAREVEIRKATPADIEVLIPAVARAFAAQPFKRWLVGSGEAALRRGKRIIELEFRKALPYHLTFTTSDLCGAALWHPPDRKIDLWKDLVWSLNGAAAVGLRRLTFSLAVTGLRLAFQEPRERHYYLAILAVDPAVQRQGIGSRLLAPGLALCDRQGIPAYLVTDTPDAVRFYQRHGFQIRRELRVFRTQLKLWTMWRQPCIQPV